MKRSVLVFTILSLFAFGTIVYAQGHGMMGMMHGGSCMGSGMMVDHGMKDKHCMLKKLMHLGLDEEQKKAVKEILRTKKKKTIKKKADLHISRIDLQTLVEEDSINIKAVEKQLNQIGSLKADIYLLRVKTLEAIKTKLTPDQRKELKEMIEQGMILGKMHGKRCGMMGKKKCGMMHHGGMDMATPSDWEEMDTEKEHAH
jgi:Spy/CpxP family protein refolding chaperone